MTKTLLLMGLYLYRLRPGKVGEVSLIGFFLLMAAVIGGHLPPGSWLDAMLVVIMPLLAVIALLDMLYKWYGYLAGTRAIVTSEVAE